MLDPTILRSFLGQTSQGRGLLVQAWLIVFVAGLARSTLTTRGAALSTLVALAALAPPTLTGHSASAGSHELAVASLLVHLLAAGLWVGGLAALAWAALAGTDGLRYAVPRFSTLAAWCFAAVAASGIVNAAVRLGSFTRWSPRPTARLVLAKVAPSACSVVSAGGTGSAPSRPRSPRAAPAVGRRESARLFLTVAGAELVVMASAVALAVGLSRTPTPAGDAEQTSVAAALLGFPLPAKPTWSRVAFGWAPDGFALAFLVLAVALYAAGVLALRRRGDRWPVGPHGVLGSRACWCSPGRPSAVSGSIRTCCSAPT